MTCVCNKNIKQNKQIYKSQNVLNANIFEVENYTNYNIDIMSSMTNYNSVTKYDNHF